MKDPYEVLGLKKGATRDEVIRKYDMLLRRHKAYQTNPDSGKKLDIDAINQAYNEIMGYNIKVEDKSTNRPRPILEKLNIDPAKYDNFWHYNGTKIVVITIIAVFLIVSIYQIATNVPYDFNVKFLGVFAADEEYLIDIQTELNENLETIDNSLVDVGMGTAQDGQVEMAMSQKLAAQMAAGELDIFICNEDEYLRYARSGFFKEISEYTDKEILEKNKDLYVDYTDETGDSFIGYYGVRVPDNGIFSEVVTVEGQEDFIFCLSVNPGDEQAQMEFWEEYVIEECLK